MPLMSLGLFVFSLGTVPFSELKRATQQRWESKNRTGAPPAYQYVGPGEDSLTLTGVLMPELTGGPGNLDTLRSMAAGGKAWILTAGTGENLGKWFIDTITETRSALLKNGASRRISFDLTLRRYWDDNPACLGNLMDSRP